MMKHKSFIVKMFGFVLTSIMALPIAMETQALAGSKDQKELPGNTCLVRQALAPYHYYDHYIENTATTPSDPNTKLPSNVYVVCPIVRDEMTSKTGLDMVKVFVNGSSDKTFYCQMEVLVAKDNSLGYKSLYLEYDMTQTVDAEGAYFHWVPPHHFNVGSTYQVYCTLPMGARLLSYQWIEHDY